MTASVAGAVVGWWFLTAIVQRILPTFVGSTPMGVVLTRSVVIGVSLGLFQQRALGRAAIRVDRWILWTSIAYALSTSLVAASVPVVSLIRPDVRYVLEIIILAVGGALMGMLQSRGFTGGSVDPRVWASVVGIAWIVGAVLPSLLPGLGEFAYSPNAVTEALWGMSVGVLTLLPIRRATERSPD